MITKLHKAINDPSYAWSIFRRRYLKIRASERLFFHAAEYRSATENGEYAAAVVRALRSQRGFENFKRNPIYRGVLEHVSREQGKAYLDILKSRDDGLLSDAKKTVLLSDSVGNPIKCRYDGVDTPLSPTTLRYVKVASDLMSLFGKGLGEVAEIGCGYGGQCLVNEKLLGYSRATLFDLPVVNELIKRYLDYTLMNGAYRTRTINGALPQSYDLVISNYAFSELPSILQRVYINKVLAKAARGYLTMNSGIGGAKDIDKLSIGELRKLLPTFEVFEEEPLTHPLNYIIVWGRSNENTKMNFVTKAV
jgi:putative sugar O-methyltransferase